jgi:hypothetical protein
MRIHELRGFIAFNAVTLAVAVEPLKRRLYRYGIDQIAIFADACRKLPADITAAELTADAVLGMGRGRGRSPRSTSSSPRRTAPRRS